MKTQNEIRRENIREQRRLNRLQNEKNDINISIFLKMIILENKED